MNMLLVEEQKNLEKLKNEVSQCRRCYISEHGPCNVFGEGPVSADVMSISEAAGEAEVAAGAPYQGKAGAYWEGMISAAGFVRGQLYITNAIKGRPLWNGESNKISPDYQEVHACQFFLLKQLEIIKPKLILVFGKVAAYSLGLLRKSDSLGSVLGERPTFEYACSDGIKRNAQMVVTYHPSYLMRGGKEKDNWLSYIHLCRAKEILNGMVSGQTQRG
jgi:uracil-DNA glycosylase